MVNTAYLPQWIFLFGTAIAYLAAGLVVFLFYGRRR